MKGQGERQSAPTLTQDRQPFYLFNTTLKTLYGNFVRTGSEREEGKGDRPYVYPTGPDASGPTWSFGDGTYLLPSRPSLPHPQPLSPSLPLSQPRDTRCRPSVSGTLTHCPLKWRRRQT